MNDQKAATQLFRGLALRPVFGGDVPVSVLTAESVKVDASVGVSAG
jgi:hypothetical protein